MSISIEEFLTLRATKPTIINAGKHAGSTEIRGAVRYRPDDLLTKSHIVLPLATDRPVVLYAERGDDDQLEAIATKLRASGFADVRVLAGGFAAYAATGEPTQEASTEQLVPPSRPQEAPALDR
jgi:rhodanese-related sulfurtransferase